MYRAHCAAIFAIAQLSCLLCDATQSAVLRVLQWQVVVYQSVRQSSVCPSVTVRYCVRKV